MACIPAIVEKLRTKGIHGVVGLCNENHLGGTVSHGFLEMALPKTLCVADRRSRLLLLLLELEKDRLPTLHQLLTG